MLPAGGEAWTRWNDRVRDQIVRRQQLEGQPRRELGIPTTATTEPAGGRIYCTALATLSLEVYYRSSALREPSSTPATPPRDASRDRLRAVRPEVRLAATESRSDRCGNARFSLLTLMILVVVAAIDCAFLPVRTPGKSGLLIGLALQIAPSWIVSRKPAAGRDEFGSTRATGRRWSSLTSRPPLCEQPGYRPVGRSRSSPVSCGPARIARGLQLWSSGTSSSTPIRR